MVRTFPTSISHCDSSSLIRVHGPYRHGVSAPALRKRTRSFIRRLASASMRARALVLWIHHQPAGSRVVRGPRQKTRRGLKVKSAPTDEPRKFGSWSWSCVPLCLSCACMHTGVETADRIACSLLNILVWMCMLRSCMKLVRRKRLRAWEAEVSSLLSISSLQPR